VTAEFAVITDDHLPHIGGSRIYVHQVASRSSPQLRVVTRERPGAREFDAEVSYPVRRVHLPGRSLPGPAAVKEAVDAAALARGALACAREARLFVAGEVTPSAFAAAAAARVRGVSYAVVLHDEPMMGAGRLEQRLRRMVLSGAAGVVAASSFPESRARELLGDRARIRRVPPGVDLDRFRPGPPDVGVCRRFGVEPGRYVIFVGRLVDYKNVDALLRAFSRLEEADLALLVVGRGPEEARLRLLAAELAPGGEPGAQARVRFAPGVCSGDLAALYRGALCYVFPSRRKGGLQHEGIGMAGLEAAACGCPVVASTATSACDYIEDGRTGLLFNPEAQAELEEVLRALLLDDQMRRRLAKAGMERVRGEFTWERTARGFLAALEEFAG